MQFHYQIEDAPLSTLDKMLEAFPRARPIWCHLAQVRYIDRASRYSPVYVESLIKRSLSLYFDTAFGDGQSAYPYAQGGMPGPARPSAGSWASAVI